LHTKAFAVPCVQEVESSNPQCQPNFAQHFKLFATASISTRISCIALVPWYGDDQWHRKLVTQLYSEYSERFCLVLILFGCRIKTQIRNLFKTQKCLGLDFSGGNRPKKILFIQTLAYIKSFVVNGRSDSPAKRNFSWNLDFKCGIF